MPERDDMGRFMSERGGRSDRDRDDDRGHSYGRGRDFDERESYSRGRDDDRGIEDANGLLHGAQRIKTLALRQGWR